MKAYTYLDDKSLSLVDRPAPEARPDNLVIRVSACAICGTDMRTYRHGSTHIDAPRTIGHEVTGVVEHVGNQVEGYAIGQRIRVVPAIGCGKCRACKKGFTNLCDSLTTIGFQYDGGFASHMAVPPSAIAMGNVLALPDGADDVAVALAEPIACVMNGQELLRIDRGDTVVVFGSGFIGCMHAELAIVAGASQVYMIEISTPRGDMARTHLNNSAIQVVNPGERGAVDFIREVTDGDGADVAIVACSAGAAQRDAIEVAAKRGRVSLFGGLAGDSVGFLDSNLIHYKELGVFGVHASTVEQNKKTQQMICSGALDARKYVSQVVGLDDIVDAFEALQAETILKAVVTP
jgi:L-iditol 2-dehydrogenase